jgi:hypothetical protein
MKDIQKIDADKTELHALKQIEKKKVLIDSSKLRPGHTCFQINNETLECVEASYEREVNFNDPDKRKITIKPNCSYINALNKANALKVFNKGGRKEIKPFMTLGEIEHL